MSDPSDTTAFSVGRDGATSNPATGETTALIDPGLDGLFLPLHQNGDEPPGGRSPDWPQQLPALFWLIHSIRPTNLAAVGSASSPAYLPCCEAVVHLRLATSCALLLPRGAGADRAEAGSQALDSPMSDLRVSDLRVPDPQLFDPWMLDHRRRFAAFSRLVLADPAAAPRHFAAQSIDLLIIDARDTAFFPGVPAGSFLSGWHDRMSADAVVVVHGIASDRDSALRWQQLRGNRPAIELHHGAGLGILAVGVSIPPALLPLVGLSSESPALARLRQRMATLGERWQGDERDLLAERDHACAQHRHAEAALRALQHRHDRLRDEFAVSRLERHRLEQDAIRYEADRRDERRHSADASAEAERRADARAAEVAERVAARLEQARAEDRNAIQALLAEMETARDVARAAFRNASATIDALQTALSDAQSSIRQRDERLSLLLGSVSWRLMRPVRSLRARLRGTVPAPETLPAPFMPRSLPAPLPLPEPAPPPPLVLAPIAAPDFPAPPAAQPEQAASAAEPLAAGGWRRIRRVLFVAGEPGTPGAAYRTERNMQACRAVGIEADCVDIAGVDPANLAAADLVVLWRAGWSGHVQIMLELAAAARTRVAFDVDDLIVQPSLAVAEIIDGIRTTFVSEAESRAYFQSMQRTLFNSDLCITTTQELAAAANTLHRMIHVVPNSFNAAVERASRRAVRLRGEQSSDGRVRLGYAGGTRTHQKDFASIVPALASVLAQRPETWLTLFRDAKSGEGLVLIHEFPELLPFADRIEWRDMVPLAELPGELARFDISLCPLEQGNPFCESKSELKYFESALADVCLVATPTGPFRRAMQHGVTGFLPETVSGWTDALLRLVDDPALRRQVARAAYHDVLWRFGPRRQAELWSLLLREWDGGAEGTRAAELSRRRGAYPPAGLPEVPDGVVLFSHDRLGDAEITVGMTSFNYETYLPEALESVLAQTIDALDLVVVDDGSRDESVALLLDWAERNRTRFNRVRILRTTQNAGLGGARNLVFDQAETPWIMVLDSDNRLAPTACETLLRAAKADGLAAFAYPQIQQFGGAELVMGVEDFQPTRLASGNYIDAMALVAKWAWAAAGGYYVRRDAMGWEDFSLWCRLVELGLHGVPVAEVLAFYRVHAASMVNAITEQSGNKQAMVAMIEQRHPWLRLRMRAAHKRLDRSTGL